MGVWAVFFFAWTRPVLGDEGALEGTADSSESADQREKTDDSATEDPYRMEWSVLPDIGYDSDIGLHFGGQTTLSKWDPAYRPYRWLGSAQLKTSVKEGPDGIEFPIHAHFVSLDHPDLLEGKLRLHLSLGFLRHISASWYGLGNNTSDDHGGYERRFQYKREIPHSGVRARVPIWRSLSVFCTVKYAYLMSDFWPDGTSRLEEDIANSRDGTGKKLYGYRDHGKLESNVGAIWDSRDDETSPTSGSFFEMSLRGSPGALTAADHNFGGINLSARQYVSLYRQWLSLAFRLTGDLLFGRVPYYELTQVEGSESFDAFGGAKGVRGVPSARYNGKVKMLASMEVRSIFWRFAIGSHRFGLGACLFADAGRLWYELKPNPQLDGRGFGLKYGVGGGPQILWGKAVVVRFDVAYSKDANPIAIYIEGGRSF